MPSPSAEAPSPGNTPPQDIRVEEDMELSDVEDSESGETQKRSRLFQMFPALLCFTVAKFE